MILNGTSTVPTSSYPYQSIGPVDFSKLNFVKTSQVDYYYGTGSASNQLLATVTQTYDPMISILEIAGLMVVFLTLLGWGIMKIRKMEGIENGKS